MITGYAIGRPLAEALVQPGTDCDLSAYLGLISSAALFSARSSGASWSASRPCT